MAEPFSGELRDGIIFGRGSCDDKGPLAVGFVVLKLPHIALATRPGKGPLAVHFVVLPLPHICYSANYFQSSLSMTDSIGKFSCVYEFTDRT